MTHDPKGGCKRPILRERAEQKGIPKASATAASARSDCDRRRSARLNGRIAACERLASRGYSRGMRYQFVDCRWELGKPRRGHELYLQGHIPGASFLDVERDLSAPP